MRFIKPHAHFLWVATEVKVGEYFSGKTTPKNLPPSLDFAEMLHLNR